MELSGKTAIITGGARGIGKATAMALAREGCNIVICSRTLSELKKSGKELSKYTNVLAIRCDVSKRADVKKMVSAAKGKFRHIDILVNSAGIAIDKPFLKTTEKEFDSQIATNLKGIFNVMQECIKFMRKKKSGIIINISSVAGKHGYANLSAYCASKFGVIGITKSVAKEFPDIKIIAVCPSGVDTRMYYSLYKKHADLKPEHIAAKILDICIHPEKYINGDSVDIYQPFDIQGKLR